MLQSNTSRAIVFATNVAWLCGAVPFKFVKPKQLGMAVLQTRFTKLRRLYCLTSFFLNCFYITFIGFRVFQKVILKHESPSVKFLCQMGYLFFSYSLPVVVQINTLNKWTEIPNFCIHYLNFFNHIKVYYFLPNEKGPNCTKFFSALLTIGGLVNLQNMVIILRKPGRIHFLTSLLSDPVETPFGLKLPIILVQMWVWISTWAHVWTFCFHLYAYTSCLLFTLRELDCKTKCPKTSNSLRRPQTLAGVLRCLHVLHRLWQNGHQNWFCPSHKAVAISVGTLSSYGFIKLSGPRSIIMGCTASLSLLYLWTLFRKFGKLHEISRGMRKNCLYDEKSSRYMKKFMRSVPIFRIDVGSFYFVKKTTVIAVLWAVLNNTVTLLLIE